MAERTRKIPRRFWAVGVVALIALVGGLLGPAAYTALTDTTAKDRIEADPPPTLFPLSVTSRIDPLVEPEAPRARELMTSWWSAHGTKADDAGFTRWLESTFPGPPSPARRNREMTEVEQLDQQRTSTGVTAASWLEDHGKKDVWKLEAHDQAELLQPSAGDRRKNDVDAMLSLSKTVADALGLHFRQSAPYVLEPNLRPDHQVAPGDVCPCSYPSRHASSAAASRTYLGYLEPQRDGEYRWFQDQIDYSRIYMAGHVASDISGGTLLGDMIGEYFLVTREGVAPDAFDPPA